MLKQQQQPSQLGLDKPRQYQLAAERRNRFEDEALRRRLDFLQWRETNLLTKYAIRHNDLRRSLALYKVTSGSSGHSQPCAGQPTGYPELRLGLSYHGRAAAAAAATGGRYQTPNLVKEGRLALKWDLQRLRPAEETSPPDRELFSVENMTRWRPRDEGYAHQAKYIRLPALESVPKNFHQCVKRAQFTAAKARGCSGRLMQHMQALPELNRQRDVRRERRRHPDREFIEDPAEPPKAAATRGARAAGRAADDEAVGHRD